MSQKSQETGAESKPGSDQTSAGTMRIDILAEIEGQDARPATIPIPRIRPEAVSDANFQEFFQRVYDAAMITDMDGRIVCVNARALDFLGYDELQLLQMNVRSLISGMNDSIVRTLHKNLESNRFTLIQARCRRRSGSTFASEIAVSRLILSGGQYMCFFVRDITLRLAAEESLREERNLLRTLIDNVPDFVYVKDRHSRFVLANAAVARLMGAAAPEDLTNKTDFDYYPHELASQYYADEHAVVTTGKPIVNKEEACVDRAGRRMLLLTTKVPLRDRQGRIVGLVGIGRDITEQRIMDNQRLHAQKMESIGQLAAGIAHEINTPIQYVGDNTRFLADSFRAIMDLLAKYASALEAAKTGPLGPERIRELQAAREEADADYLVAEIPKAIEQSLDGVNRVANIVHAMKEFSHPDAEQKAPADLNKAIESTVTVSRNEWKYVADMKLDLDPALPMVPCLVGHFNQVILNLIVNAAHAISEVVGDGSKGKGLITVSTRAEGDTVAIRVSDNGTGIPRAIRHRIFEPFFTTKEVGRGTGQGLSTCHAIVVKRHQGTLSFETEEGKGTTFTVRLPLQDKGQAS